MKLESFLSKYKINANKTKNTIIHDTFDQYTFNTILQQSEQLQKLPKLFKEDFPTIDPLIFDTFNAFYKYSPKFYNDSEIQEEYLINKEVLKKAINTEEYQKLRTITKLDEVNSAVATVTFVQTVIQELIKRNPKIQEQIQQIQQQRNQMLKTLQQIAQLQSQLPQLPKHQRQQAQKQLNQLQQQLNQIQQNINQQAQNLKKQVTQIAVSKAIQKAREKAQEMNQTIQALSWGRESSTLQKVPAEERFKLANALLRSKKLLELAKLLGRFKHLAITTKKQKIKRQVSEIYEISIGNNLQHVIPTELAKLQHPLLKLDFLKRFAEKQLIQYSLRSKDTLAKGDFIVCLDLSGSMSGERELWAKAVALATLEIAIREKRGWALITFSENVKSVRKFDKKQKPSISEILEIAEEFYGGGTNFELPLSKAVELLEHGFSKKADILFITDGECEVSNTFVQEFNEFKKKNEVKVISVFIFGQRTDTLEKFSDKVILAHDLAKDVQKVFESIF